MHTAPQESEFKIFHLYVFSCALYRGRFSLQSIFCCFSGTKHVFLQWKIYCNTMTFCWLADIFVPLASHPPHCLKIANSLLIYRWTRSSQLFFVNWKRTQSIPNLTYEKSKSIWRSNHTYNCILSIHARKYSMLGHCYLHLSSSFTSRKQHNHSISY